MMAGLINDQWLPGWSIDQAYLKSSINSELPSTWTFMSNLCVDPVKWDFLDRLYTAIVMTMITFWFCCRPCRWRRLLLNMIQEWFSQTFHFLKFLFVCFFTVAAALLLRLSQWFDTSMHFKEAHSIWALAILFVLFVTAWILGVI